jgi:hypothetical protein
VSIVKFPEMHGDRSRSGVTEIRGRARQMPGRLGAALDVAWTLLVLVCIGSGIVLLRFLLALARGAIGH